MALGRLKRIQAPIGSTQDMRRMVRSANLALREFDRRKPVTSPTPVNDNASRPAAESNAGRIIYVKGATPTASTFQYSDGTTWRSVLASTISFASPTITYGTTASAGALSTTIRSDARLKYPIAVMSSANSSTLTLTDDGTDMMATHSIGRLDFSGPNGWAFRAIDGAAATAVSISGDSDAGNRTLLKSAWSGGAASSITLASWDSVPPLNGIWATSTIVGYDMSGASVAPSATSGTDNKIYGARLRGGTAAGTNGGFTEAAACYVIGPTRSGINNPANWPLTCGIIADCPTVGRTEQTGILIRQQTGQIVATTRYGLRIEAQNSGTTKWAIYAPTDASFFGTLRQDDSVKHIWGTGLDATAYYDATNLIIDPDEVGTGRVLIGATGDDDMLLNAIEIDGDLNHDGAGAGFFGTAPAAQSTGWTLSNVTEDKVLDANSYTADEIADVLGTVIQRLIDLGLITT